MAATVTITKVDVTQTEFIAEGTIALTGSYGGAATHGDTLSFAGFDQLKSNSVPTHVEIFEAPPAGTAPTGYQLGFAPGTTQANGQITVMNGAATEYTQASAYSAALLAAVINFRAYFPAFL